MSDKREGYRQKIKEINSLLALCTIPIQDLPNGMYVIKIENSKKTTTYKFYKN
ncbi:hypothetical protein MASR1M65_29970 [Saprospiraceae bacterium]|nr:T9SS type A sorting domain-containing protein [Saprospiraceae bacterium]